ncbi:RIPOR family member 3-like [Oncorhynchus kisutch]|uniref:RIPOR family member 3-like n=1 Tax=Oncorhynchus kisutch TaxID=8019 RepID=UPI0012DCE189|nr:RIPOR family member 3-like [Oncorhynchus kisutch]
MESPKRRMAFKKLKGRCIAELLPLGCTLHLLASPQTEANHKVSQAASNCLRTKVAFRTKAVVYYTEILRNSYVQLQQTACLALKCLKAMESVEQEVELWWSSDEDLRSAVRETVLSYAFNTIVPDKLIINLEALDLNPALCNWVLDFLTCRPRW